MSKPRMCPHCRAFIDSKDKTCQYCGNALPITAATRLRREARMSMAGMQVGFTTIILLLINAALFVASLILTIRFAGETGMLANIDGQVLLMMGGKFKLSILIYGEWWRLLTANFLHGNLMHLGFNMMALYNLGPIAEDIFGTPRFLVFYLATGCCGFVASTMWSDGLSIGASASICGLIGALYGFGRRNFNSHLQSVTKRWIIVIAIFGILVPAIDNAAHLGGLLAGLGFGYFGGTPGQDPGRESIWKGASIGVVTLAVAAFFLAYRNLTLATG